VRVIFVREVHGSRIGPRESLDALVGWSSGGRDQLFWSHGLACYASKTFPLVQLLGETNAGKHRRGSGGPAERCAAARQSSVTTDDDRSCRGKRKRATGCGELAGFSIASSFTGSGRRERPELRGAGSRAYRAIRRHDQRHSSLSVCCQQPEAPLVVRVCAAQDRRPLDDLVWCILSETANERRLELRKVRSWRPCNRRDFFGCTGPELRQFIEVPGNTPRLDRFIGAKRRRTGQSQHWRLAYAAC